MKMPTVILYPAHIRVLCCSVVSSVQTWSALSCLPLHNKDQELALLS